MLDFGSGTREHPYQITKLEELQAVNQDLSAWYELKCDIDAKETNEWNEWEGFNPIGSKKDPFNGTFIGNNFEIINLNIKRPDSDDIGLFGCNNGHIKNIGITNADVRGNSYIGGLIGYNRDGRLESSYVKGESVSSSVKRRI